jgi:hypothetical protein
MSKDIEGELLPADPLMARFVQTMTSQNAYHGLMARTLNEVMEEDPDYLREFARNFPNRFLTLLQRSQPNMMPQQGLQGDVHLHVHQSLIPTDLDG